MASDFIVPEFLEDCDADTIHARMMDELPNDIDKTEGGFPWDFTRPTALIAAELLQFYIPEAIKLMFPQWSSGSFLDYLAAGSQTKRKASTYAEAVLTLTGEPGTIVPAGTVFATEAKNDQPSIEFAAVESCILNEEGKGTVLVRALLDGKQSNVNAGAIVLMSEPVEGIQTVTNKEKATGGTEEESDDDLRERILEADASEETSYIGNNADYKRWAKAVDGIGDAIVIPEWNGPETVKIVYDEKIISLEEILKKFLLVIDPTSLNKQGEDEGSSYRSGIYYTDDKDSDIIVQMIQDEQKKYDRPIVVEILPLTVFYKAEEYHQKYLEKNPEGYCHIGTCFFKNKE